MTSQPQQSVGDLRALVTRRVGLGKRVALLGTDPQLVKLLETNKCELLVDPPSYEALAHFRPGVVVAFDGLLSEGARGLEALRPVIGDAELVLSFANAASASAVVDASTGGPLLPAWNEATVRGWLRGAGYVVASRDVVVGARGASKLSADTEAALRQLLEQLNPAAAIDRLLVVAKKGVEASPVEQTAGLTTVIVAGGLDVGALQGTVRSVLGQLHKPVELLVVSPLFETQLEDVTREGKGRAGVTVVLMPGEEGSPLALTNRALQRAQGQYVCCLEAGELLERDHLQQLVKALEASTAAWAVSASPRVTGAFDLRAWLGSGDVQRGRFLVDRSRLGGFALEWPEAVAEAEAMVFTRLAAVFPPVLSGATPTFDTTRVVSSQPEALLPTLRARPLRMWRTVAEALKPPPEIDLTAEVEARLEAQSPRAARWFSQARSAAARVADAARRAREAADEELGKKR